MTGAGRFGGDFFKIAYAFGSLSIGRCMTEVEIRTAVMYAGNPPNRAFDAAADRAVDAIQVAFESERSTARTSKQRLPDRPAATASQDVLGHRS